MSPQTVEAAQEEFIAIHIGAVVIHIIGRLAMGTLANRGFILPNRDDEPIIKDKQLPLPMIAPLLQPVIDDAAVELVHLFKTLFFHQG